MLWLNHRKSMNITRVPFIENLKRDLIIIDTIHEHVIFLP